MSESTSRPHGGTDRPGGIIIIVTTVVVITVNDACVAAKRWPDMPPSLHA